MGSLTSRPSIPQVQQQPVFISVPAAAPPPPPPANQGAAVVPPGAPDTSFGAGADTAGSGAAGTPTEESQRLAREDNLLRRSRGRLGTVLTGFSGILSQAAGQAGRKTLLGE